MDFSKLKRAKAAPQPDDNETVEAIIQVKTPDYIPQDVKVRARVDERIFTCQTTYGVLKRLKDDPQVESVKTSETLRIIE